MKSATIYLSSWNSVGIRGMFLLFRKWFNRDQYVLGFLWELVSLPLIRIS